MAKKYLQRHSEPVPLPTPPPLWGLFLTCPLSPGTNLLFLCWGFVGEEQPLGGPAEGATVMRFSVRWGCCPSAAKWGAPPEPRGHCWKELGTARTIWLRSLIQCPPSSSCFGSTPILTGTFGRGLLKVVGGRIGYPGAGHSLQGQSPHLCPQDCSIWLEKRFEVWLGHRQPSPVGATVVCVVCCAHRRTEVLATHSLQEGPCAPFVGGGAGSASQSSKSQERPTARRGRVAPLL